MRLRGNLFVKVFIAFWLVTCAILGSWMLTADYFDSRPPAGVAGEQPAGPPHRFVLRMMYDLQSLARVQSKAASEKVSGRVHRRLSMPRIRAPRTRGNQP